MNYSEPSLVLLVNQVSLEFPEKMVSLGRKEKLDKRVFADYQEKMENQEKLAIEDNLERTVNLERPVFVVFLEDQAKPVNQVERELKDRQEKKESQE